MKKNKFNKHGQGWWNEEELKDHGLKMTNKESPHKVNHFCCFDAAKLMLSFTGATQSGPINKIQTFIAESGKGELTNQALLGIKYIDGQLREGKAVMIGVDKGVHRTINETVTDHFIIIAGKYKEGDKWYYHFMDAGTKKKSTGLSKDYNRLYINSNKVSTDKYTLSQIRTNEVEN